MTALLWILVLLALLLIGDQLKKRDHHRQAAAERAEAIADERADRIVRAIESLETAIRAMHRDLAGLPDYGRIAENLTSWDKAERS